MTPVLSALLFLAQPAGAQISERRNVIESISEALKKDAAFSASEQTALLAALRARFADYALQTVNPQRETGVAVALRMIVEGHFDQTSFDRVSEVSFSAYQAISRGAPADVVEGIALYGYRKKISGDRISVWANGYRQLTDGKVPADVAADLVRVAMERDWDDNIFNTFKWALVQGAKDKFNLKDYAVYLLGHMSQGGRRPGELTATARAYFRKMAKMKKKPELPSYEGAFSSAPAPTVVYEAQPRESEDASPAQVAETKEVKPAILPAKELPRATPKTTMSENEILAELTKGVEDPAPPPKTKPAAKPKPEPPPDNASPRELGLMMERLWPGLESSSKSYLGTPYVWGGVTRRGIDCSALTQNSYSENKVGIPRVSRQQWKTGDRVELEKLAQGDLVFFNTMGVGVSHVGMVTSTKGPKFIHASSSRGVVIDDMSKKYYMTRYLGARRIIP